MQVKRLRNWIALLVVLLMATGCLPGVQGGLSEGWRIGELISQGEQVESFTEVRTVRHCGPVLEQKTVSCTAGTLNEMAIMTQARAGVSLGLEVTLDAGVSSALGIDRKSGESLELVPPPNGLIYNYAVTTQYRIVSGEALATNFNGDEQTMTYLFQASCTLQIETVEESPCLLSDLQAAAEPGEPTSEAEATRKQTESAESLLDEANGLYQRADYTAALAKYSEAIELDGSNPIAFNQRGNANRKLMSFDQAVQDYGAALDLAASPFERAIFLNNRAAAHREMGSMFLALSDIEQAIDLNPEFAGAYENQALIYQAMQDDVNTVLSYNIFLRLSPQNFNALVQRGNAYLRLENYEAAIQDFSGAISLMPEAASVYKARGLAFEASGDSQKAVLDLTQALEVNPDFALAYFERGRILLQAEEYEAAAQDLDAAIKTGYGNSEAYLLRGETNLALEFNQQALEDYTRAIELDPQVSVSYRGRGLALYRLEDFQSAVENFNRAIELSQDEAVLYYYRGAARKENGDYRRALEDLNFFLVLDPENELRPEVEALIREITERLENS